MKTLKSIIVTGASTGIGYEIAISLASLHQNSKFYVYAGCRKLSDVERIDQLKIPNLKGIQLDVVDDNSVTNAVKEIKLKSEESGSGPLYGLVNNAGIASAGPIEFFPIEEFKDILEVNLFGLIRMTQACLPMLRESRGRIVNMGSIAGKVTSPLMGAYSASKHAVEAVSDASRRELKYWGISVSLIEPGVIDTPIWTTSLARTEKLISALPERGKELYGKLIKSRLSGMSSISQGASTPAAVSQRVIHALTAKSPDARYLVGNDAKIGNILRHLPDKWLDMIIAGRAKVK